MMIENPHPDIPAPDASSQGPDAPASDSAAVTVSTEPTAPAWPDWAPPMPDVQQTERLNADRPMDFDEVVGAIDTPAAHPGDYRLPNFTGGEEITPEAMQEVRGLQSALWHAGLPVDEGNTLMAILAEEGQRIGMEMDDVAFDQQIKATERTFEEMLGREEYARQRGELSRLLNDLNEKTGGKFGDYLGDQAHVLIQPRVYARLLQHASRLQQRKRS